MTALLSNYVAGRWQAGSGAGTALIDPVLGTELVRVDASGLDLAAAFAFAREAGGTALRAMTYRERAAMLAAAGKVLQAHRDAYYDIATANSGTVKNDSAVDIDGGLFTLGICGSSAGLLDQLEAFDVVSFTGSAETAALIRSHPAVVQRSVRVNIEADSVNSALVLPGEAADSAAFELFAKEVAREMTVKSGQKCTAIRRAFVPEALYAAAADAITARLAKTTVGNPRNDTVRMGALVSRAQLGAVREGLAYLQQQAGTLHDGAKQALIDADSAIACCVGPTLLGTRDAAGSDAADRVHDTEVFGPVATLVPYRHASNDIAHALALVRRGQGSLVTSLYGSDPATLAAAALDLADSHGRVHVISPDVAALHRDAAVAARRPRPRGRRRGTRRRARTEFLSLPRGRPGQHRRAGEAATRGLSGAP